MLPGATSATASRFKPNAVRHAATFRGRRWRAFTLLLALSAAVALGYAYVHEAQANQRLRAMLQVQILSQKVHVNPKVKFSKVCGIAATGVKHLC